MTSNANDLTERLRRRLETERQAIEELTADELDRLGENSRRVARNALRTIERDTEAATGRMRALLLRAWLRPLVVGLSLWLGICGGSWATMHWLWTRIQGSSPELCVKVRGSSSMLLLGCLGDLLRFEKREIQVATFAPDRSSP